MHAIIRCIGRNHLLNDEFNAIVTTILIILNRIITLLILYSDSPYYRLIEKAIKMYASKNIIIKIIIY
jgi:hypothetical protein